ncbi:MAG: YdcF family protein [Bacteroidetes bacterium]|nr:YdcF family protein [Bacteroidota bacterium]
MVVRMSLLYPVLTLFGCAFSSKTSKKLLAEASAKRYDIVVVPGVPLENGKWSRTMKGRVYWSKFLFDKGIAKNLMYSGSAVYTPYYEGLVMAMYAEALGIPKEHIFSETKAEHSTENIYYSYYKAKQMGFKTIALASDPFQSKSLRKFAHKKLSPDVGIIPFVVDTMRAMEPLMIDPAIDYQQAFKKDFVSIKKREGFWKRLRGTYGKNIDTTAYRSRE